MAAQARGAVAAAGHPIAPLRRVACRQPCAEAWAHVGISSAVWSGFAQIEELRSQLDEERVARKKLEATVRAVSHGGSHGTRSGDATRRGTDTARTVRCTL